jgi:hypothetical protein
MDALKSRRDSLKQEIFQKCNQLVNLMRPYFSRPHNEVLLTPSFRGRLAAMIKNILCRHQVLYNVLMELADCRARMQGQNSSTWTAEAMAEYNEVGRKMGQQFYRVAGFMNENDRNQLMSQSGFHWEP